MMSALLLAISMLAPGSLGKRPFLSWVMLNIETLQSFYEIAVEHKALVPFYCYTVLGGFFFAQKIHLMLH